MEIRSPKYEKALAVTQKPLILRRLSCAIRRDVTSVARGVTRVSSHGLNVVPKLYGRYVLLS